MRTQFSLKFALIWFCLVGLVIGLCIRAVFFSENGYQWSVFELNSSDPDKVEYIVGAIKTNQKLRVIYIIDLSLTDDIALSEVEFNPVRRNGRYYFASQPLAASSGQILLLNKDGEWNKLNTTTVAAKNFLESIQGVPTEIARKNCKAFLESQVGQEVVSLPNEHLEDTKNFSEPKTNIP